MTDVKDTGTHFENDAGNGYVVCDGAFLPDGTPIGGGVTLPIVADPTGVQPVITVASGGFGLIAKGLLGLGSDPGGSLSISAGAATGNSNAAAFIEVDGNTPTRGGSAYLVSGAGNGDGAGSIALTAGDDLSGSAGGSVQISAGAGAQGGNISIASGNGDGSLAGTVSITLGTGTPNGQFILSNLPTADPHVINAVWNNAGVLTISAG